MRKGSDVILKEYISTLDPQEKIKIGANKGNEFFYVGTAEDFLLRLTDYEEGNVTYYDKRVNRIKSKLLSALNKDTSFSGWSKTQFKQWEMKGSTPIFGVDAYNAFLKSHSALITKMFDQVKVEKQNRFLRKPLPIRQVSEHFTADHAVEHDKVIVIMIEGKEKGAFWGLYETDGTPQIGYLGMKTRSKVFDDGD